MCFFPSDKLDAALGVVTWLDMASSSSSSASALSSSFPSSVDMVDCVVLVDGLFCGLHCMSALNAF